MKASRDLFLATLVGLLLLGSPGFLFAELDEPPQGIETGERAPAAVLQNSDMKPAGQSLLADEAETAVMDSLRRGVLVSVSWILLTVGFLLVALTLRKTYLWLAAVQRARVPPTRYFNLQFQVRSPEGDFSLHNFDYFPVVVAARGNADLLLAGAADEGMRFRVDYHRGQAQLSSESTVIVNGVPRRQKPLKQDDRIIFGAYRLVFKDASIREQPPPVPGKPIFAWQFPIVALLLALSVLFKQAGAVPEDRMLLAKAAELEEARQQVELLIAQQQAEEPREAEMNVPVVIAAEQSEDSPDRITMAQRLQRLFVRSEKRSETSSEAEKVRVAVTEAKVQGRETEIAEKREGQLKEEQLTAPEPPFVQEQRFAAAAEPQPVQPRQQYTPVAAAQPGAAPGRQSPVASTQSTTRQQQTENISAASLQKPREIKPAPLKSEEPIPTGVAISKRETPSRTPAVPPPTPAREPAAPPVETVAEVPQPQSVAATSGRQDTSLLSQRRADRQVPVVQASVLGSIVPAAVQNNSINPLEGLSFAKARTVPDPGRTKVRVIPPGRPVEYFKADILFIHAHPDDESIDFGSLMARASRSQKRIATLILTDGESGLDLYPERKVGDIYPARDLTGRALSQVRVVEATRALSLLGSEMYIRWGLENRPYNSKRDEVSPDEVIRGWGGEEQLVSGLLEVLEGFRPTIVVSPDCHSKAYEHFEHEAVGQLVQTALDRLGNSGKSSVKAHLVSIDPYQVDRYSDVTTVDARLQDSQSGFTYRAIQTLALKEHVTQRDAAVIAASRLSQLPNEYYKILFWDLNGSLDDYLK